MTDKELKAKLLEVESGTGGGDCTSNWHRNPEGPQAVARIEELKTALTGLLEPFGDDPCRFDHHGYCQQHFLQEANECCVKIARDTLKGADDDG